MNKFFTEADHDAMVAEKAIREAAAEAEREAARIKALADERAAKLAERAPFLTEIAAAVRTIPSSQASHAVHVAELVDGELWVDGVNCAYIMGWDWIYTRGHGRFGFGAKPTNTRKITVRAYTGGKGADTKVFRQLKTGGFNYTELARELVNHAAYKNRAERAKSVSEDNEPVAAALRAELGIGQYDYREMRVTASSNVTRPVRIVIAIDSAMTVEQAKKLHAALIAAGVITKK